MKPLSVCDYCLKVQERVIACKPEISDPSFQDWFYDTGRASNAVLFSIDCKNSDALAIAEKLSRKYSLPD